MNAKLPRTFANWFYVTREPVDQASKADSDDSFGASILKSNRTNLSVHASLARMRPLPCEVGEG